VNGYLLWNLQEFIEKLPYNFSMNLISDLTDEEIFTLFPNPTNGIFYVSSDQVNYQINVN